MTQVAPVESRYTTQAYFDLVAAGIMRPEDRVELLEGVIVALSPQNPPHAAATSLVDRALREAIGRRAAIRVQLPLLAGPYSAPEPDVAVVPGRESDYSAAHPSTALLVVEVADSSLVQDRLTKAAVYAAAGIPEYWLVNLRDDCVEVFRIPEPAARRYAEKRLAHRGERVSTSSPSPKPAWRLPTSCPKHRRQPESSSDDFPAFVAREFDSLALRLWSCQSPDRALI